MIHLSRIHDAGSIVVNSDLIETIEACPDTTITLMTHRKLVVQEPVEEVISRVVEFRRRVNEGATDAGATTSHEAEAA